MVNRYPFQFLLIDNESLSQYKTGLLVSYKDIRRRLFLKSRDQNKSLPDHYYRLIIENAFSNIETLTDIFTVAIPDLASAYLHDDENRILIKTNKVNIWQELITFFPPLLLQCAYLHQKEKTIITSNEYHTFFLEKILPNTKYTCIPSPRIKQLDYYVNQQGGLHDLHIHLNGTLETDHVWQDFLRNPIDIYLELKEGFKKERVKEQLEQESVLLEAKSFKDLLLIAQRLRIFFFDYIINNANSFTSSTQSPNLILSEILNANTTSIQGSYKHPFLPLINNDPTYSSFMSIEGFMYILILQYLRDHPSTLLANLFHFYLLILGLSNRLLVQQTHQVGFEQFQKHTLNAMRYYSEKEFERRYHQLHGNDNKYIKFLEGRFAPQKNEAETKTLIDKIFKGWNAMIKTLYPKKEEADKPTLKLIAHFIKEPENEGQIKKTIRHRALRLSLWKKGQALSLLIKNHQEYKDKVAAVDAASSEFDAAPEVFAPVFRLMRRSGIKNFTYHAGEDFYHILSGLRAIYEAIEFCGLKNGNRIGHATASGLSVNQWKEAIGKSIVIRQGEYLDNLIFTYHLIGTYKLGHLNHLLPSLTLRVQALSQIIYKATHSIDVLVQSWKLRQCCPFHTLENDIENVHPDLKCEEEWNYPIKEQLLKTHNNADNEAWQIYTKYHSPDFRETYKKIINIDPFEIILPEELKNLQLALLGEMNNREIVIETLPTSNVRIGFHKNYDSYHLYNWINWKKEGHSIPPIVVGSDDTGIFSTNIYNEYANIYCMLLNQHKYSHSQIMELIKRLDEDSHIYRFE